MRTETPTPEPTLSWDETFGQRKAHLAKEWKGTTEWRRKCLIEQMLCYSAIHEVKEL